MQPARSEHSERLGRIRFWWFIILGPSCAARESSRCVVHSPRKIRKEKKEEKREFQDEKICMHAWLVLQGWALSCCAQKGARNKWHGQALSCCTQKEPRISDTACQGGGTDISSPVTLDAHTTSSALPKTTPAVFPLSGEAFQDVNTADERRALDPWSSFPRRMWTCFPRRQWRYTANLGNASPPFQFFYFLREGNPSAPRNDVACYFCFSLIFLIFLRVAMLINLEWKPVYQNKTRTKMNQSSLGG